MEFISESTFWHISKIQADLYYYEDKNTPINLAQYNISE